MKSSEAASLRSVSSIPRSSAMLRSVDEVDRLLGVAGEDPDQDGDPEQAGVVLGDPAAELDLDPVDGAVAEALGEPAELLAQRDEGRQRLHRLRAHRGDVDRVGDHAAGERGAHLLGGDDPGPVLGLGGRGAQVRRDDDVVALEERVLGERLLGEDVERGAGDPARLEPLASARRGRPARPRAQLTIRDPSRIFAIASASIKLIVSGVFGRWRVMKSARA